MQQQRETPISAIFGTIGTIGTIGNSDLLRFLLSSVFQGFGFTRIRAPLLLTAGRAPLPHFVGDRKCLVAGLAEPAFQLVGVLFQGNFFVAAALQKPAHVA
jgi:hypothetical protein